MTKAQIVKKSKGKSATLNLITILGDISASFSSKLSLLESLNKTLVKLAKEMRPYDAASVISTFGDFSKLVRFNPVLSVANIDEMQRAFTRMRDILESIRLPDFTVKFIREMSLVYLIAEFEAFLSKSLDAVFEYKPDSMKNRERTITFEEALSFETTKQLRMELASREIDSIINSGNIEATNDRISKKYKFFDLSGQKDWKDFKERFFRRNVIVHNSGRADAKYRGLTKFKGKEDDLIIDEEYLSDSVRLFRTYSKTISSGLINKFGKAS